MLRKIFRTRRSGVPGLGFFVCLSLAFAPFLMAQTTGTGALTGKVIDASGGVVANATITATSVDTGQARTTTTGTDGSYKFDGLLAFALLAPPALVAADSQWALQQCTLTLPCIPSVASERGGEPRGARQGSLSCRTMRFPDRRARQVL